MATGVDLSSDLGYDPSWQSYPLTGVHMRKLVPLALLVGSVSCGGYFTRVDPRVSPEDKATCSPMQGSDCRPRDPRKAPQPGRTPADTFAKVDTLGLRQ